MPGGQRATQRGQSRLQHRVEVQARRFHLPVRKGNPPRDQESVRRSAGLHRARAAHQTSRGPAEMTPASAYFSGIARVFERIEVTGPKGVAHSFDEGMAKAVDLVLTLKGGGKALLIGNGGSAAIVSHIHN